MTKWSFIRQLHYKFKLDLIMGNVHWKSVINMTNGVIGVSILAMPYCFFECGLVLGTLALLFIAYLTSFSCRLIIKSSDIKQSRTFEYLALRSLGPSGKLFTEICIISLLLGSLIACQQLVGDNSTPLASELFNLELNATLRAISMILLTFSIALPLSLFKKLDRLTSASTLAISFYAFFSFYMVLYGFSEMKTGEWLNKISYWKFSGLFKSIPIFSISFTCQTVLLVVYDELPDPTPKKMYKVIDYAICVVFCLYWCTGFFGYIAFSSFQIHGNVITHIPKTFICHLIIIGFLMCIVVGFPFMVLPCRTSLNTLLFSPHPKDDSNEFEPHITETNFKHITYAIILITTITAIMIPNIEFVLGFTGATSGSLISFILPAMIYIYINAKSSKPKTNIMTRFLLYTGVILLVCCTINTLYNFDERQSHEHYKQLNAPYNTQLRYSVTEAIKDNKVDNAIKNDENNEPRLEPPNPVDFNGGNENNNKEDANQMINQLNKEKQLIQEQNSMLNELKKQIGDNVQQQQGGNLVTSNSIIIEKISELKVLDVEVKENEGINKRSNDVQEANEANFQNIQNNDEKLENLNKSSTIKSNEDSLNEKLENIAVAL